MRPQILVVDDEQEVCNFFRHLLARKDYEVAVARSGEETKALLGERPPFDLALVDLKLPDCEGLSLLPLIKKKNPACEVIVMTGYSTIKSAVASIQSGAYDYIEKPFEVIEDLEALIEKALYLDHFAEEQKEINEQFGFVIGKGYAMQRLVSLAEKIAPKNITVLIQGETGTGKEVLAHFIHGMSRRATQSFIAVNCGAFTETLLESELFGHEKGSFTGATSLRRGVFEIANHGTLFLDEIGTASPAIQVKLLRVLETGEFFRVGSEKPLKTDVRIIAATNVDLKAEVAAKRFREDLFYRLDVASLWIPPLRERKEDIPIFAHYFAQKAAASEGKVAPQFSPEALALLTAYPWPGNIRELANVVTQAVTLSEGAYIQPKHLPEKIIYPPEELTLPSKTTTLLEKKITPPSLDETIDRTVAEIVSTVDLSQPLDLSAFLRTVRQIEIRTAREIIGKALEVTRGDRQAATELLGITRRVMRYLLHERPKR